MKSWGELAKLARGNRTPNCSKSKKKTEFAFPTYISHRSRVTAKFVQVKSPRFTISAYLTTDELLKTIAERSYTL
jgi:hypothetical protein